MFPEPYHMPSHRREDMIHLLILRDVPLDLRYPVFPVRPDGLAPVLPVIAMPEVTVTEDGDAVFPY